MFTPSLPGLFWIGYLALVVYAAASWFSANPMGVMLLFIGVGSTLLLAATLLREW
jgi:hypothetical protein